MYARLNLVLFTFLSFKRGNANENINFCFQEEKKDHRFNGSLIARLLVPYLPVCVLYCLNNECCRSVNVLKAKGMDKENCELLSVVAEDHPEFLIDDRDYTYSILTQPIRGKNCSCLTCGAFCLKENCSCTYNHDGKKQCTDGIFKILVSSEGHRDVNGTKSWGHSVIKINGKDYSKNHRGFNIVVLDGENGRVEKAINFDTHTDATDMTAFLQNITSEMSKIIIAAIKDEGAWAMTPETYKALSKLAGETVSDINHRGSFAMIGFSGDDKPSFVKQEKKSKNEGHVVIEDIIHIPVIKN